MDAGRKRCEDRISSLPDEVLHYILSFLDMWYVVRTCILSKRWRSLWTSVPYINLDMDILPFYIEDFINFLYNVLFCRDQSNIHTFRLIHNDAHVIDSYEINSIFDCVSIALKDNVRELNLELLASIHLPEIELPRCLLNSRSLVKLNLDIDYDNKYFIKVFISLPESVNLPNLKLLKLQKFGFRDSRHSSLTIYAAQLKHLEICVDEYSDKNKVSISSPMLKSFRCECCISDEYFLEDLSSLDRADIDMGMGWRTSDAEIYRKMMKFLGGLCNAKSLALSVWLLEVLPRADELLPMSFSARHLKVTIWLSKYCFQSIKYLLESSYNLETLEVHINDITDLAKYCDFIERWEYQEAVEVLSKCTSFHKLRFVEIHNAEGFQNEVELIKLMLKNTVALGQLTIGASKEHSRTIGG
ncbi:hypothetical protein IFM89_019493 [Coptis chinensis]|uniref:F-box domain-containing protein n=1 Tax=Coptis chinensis TaxID=261450 RepID=A0A835LE67_9MAGN|nr:hypothetical protein IFM89_019493 [Coptis chinensis]